MAVSELYGSSHDSGGDNYRPPDRGYGASGSGWTRPWQIGDSDRPRDDDTVDDYFEEYYQEDPDLSTDRYADATERALGMTRLEYAEYVRNYPDGDGAGGESDDDSDTCAILHEDNHRPESRTRRKPPGKTSVKAPPTPVPATAPPGTQNLTATR